MELPQALSTEAPVPAESLRLVWQGAKMPEAAKRLFLSVGKTIGVGVAAEHPAAGKTTPTGMSNANLLMARLLCLQGYGPVPRCDE